jgi:hypothetical protein
MGGVMLYVIPLWQALPDTKPPSDEESMKERRTTHRAVAR